MLAMNAQFPGERSAKQRPKLEYSTGQAARAAAEACWDKAYMAASIRVPRSNGLGQDWSGEHVATAADRQTGECVALLAASRQLTSREPFLLIEQVYIASGHSPAALLRRLVAMVLLRVAGSDGMPAAIAVRTPDDWPVETFLSLTQQFTGSVRYPPADGAAIPLSSAHLTKRIASAVAPSIRYDLATSALRGARIASNTVDDVQKANGTSSTVSLPAKQAVTGYDELLLVIDLRSEDETVLIDDARQAYRRP